MNREAIQDIITQRAFSFARLAFFCEFAEKGSIAAASNHNASKQSMGSKWIGQLEEAMGIQLIRENGRNRIPTRDGEALARLFREMIEELGAFMVARRRRVTTVRLGAANSTIEWLIAPRISEVQDIIRRDAKKYGQAHKDFHVQFEFHRTRDVLRGLLDLTLDLGILRSDGLETPGKKHVPKSRAEGAASETKKGTPGPDINSLKLREIGYTLFVPAGLMPPGRSPRLKDLLATVPLATARGEQFRARLEKAAAEAGLALKIKLACDSFTQAARAVASGRYAGILPDTAATDLPEERYRRFDLDGISLPPRELVVAWNKRMAEINPRIPEIAKTLAKTLH